MTTANSSERLAELINFSVDAVVVMNAHGVIQWANPAGSAITVDSERGRGASFKVYLPAVTGESQ